MKKREDNDKIIEELKRAHILMDRNLFKQLRRYAFHKELSISEVARKAIRQFFDEK